MISTEKLQKIIEHFWASKGRNSIYYLGKCSDFSYALKTFLKGGDIYLVGYIPNSNIAWHTVLFYNQKFWDIRGANDLAQIRQRNPVVCFNDDSHTVTKANYSQLEHIRKLLDKHFVNDTINGLKQAEKVVR